MEDWNLTARENISRNFIPFLPFVAPSILSLFLFFGI